MDQLIKSLHRSEESVATFTGLEVDSGESLADTAAQKAEEALFHQFGLKPRVINNNNQVVCIGGKASVLGKVEMPSGTGGVNGVVRYTVVIRPGVPPLTLVSILKQVGTLIDLNNDIETTTSLRVLSSRHVAHKLIEFVPDCWKALTPWQTKFLQAR